MCNYLNDNNNQREIFVETIQEKLIGPGSNVFGLDKLEELIDKNPVKLYYSGILFSLFFLHMDRQNKRLKDKGKRNNFLHSFFLIPIEFIDPIRPLGWIQLS